jgi:hypothetical protein
MKTPNIKKLTNHKPTNHKPTSHKPSRGIPQAIVRASRDYAVPGGVALGAGLVVATGILFRKPLQGIGRLFVGTALHGGTAAMKMLESGLVTVGARRRRPSAMVIAGAGLGAVGVLAAGSALTVWLISKRTTHSEGRPNGAFPKSASDSLESTSVTSHS